MPSDPEPEAEPAEAPAAPPQNPNDLAWWIKIHTGPNNWPFGFGLPL